MNEREEQKPPMKKNMNVTVPEISVAEFKRQSSLDVSPRSHVMGAGRPRFNCLCSPTTHAGSFRCRHHRVPGMTRGGSVGSNLSLLASKSGPLSDSLQAQ
ncbi:hypothetical protein CFOL_v3_03181 [Cephalotus follicularis]|uniref:Uncharacterized protein n=1 Tax=Cephalotus follicularis TaxID=3775 RepID=A0A1Q3AVD9_CEPFO|nr:hypothetical protein CFOL_v3_03181 [Cephalotus follicularis]